MKKTCQADDISVSELRQKVLTQQESFEEAQRIQREEAELRAEEERRERREREEEELREKRERERLRKEVEDRANREARLEKIKKDQEVAIRNAKLQSAMVCMYVHVYTFTYIYVHVCMYMYVCVTCTVHVCMYIRTCIMYIPLSPRRNQQLQRCLCPYLSQLPPRSPRTLRKPLPLRWRRMVGGQWRMSR